MPRLTPLLLLALSLLPLPAVQAAERGGNGIDAMVESLQMERKIDLARAAIINLWLSDKPHMKPYRNTLDSFMQEYISWSAMRDEFHREFASRFSSAELAEIERFYASGPGRRLAQAIEEVLSLYIESAKRRMEADQGRLQQMIREEAERLEKLQKQQ
ncbi:MAG TPA: DUF2059 domain-containing protein [Gammaproteobacteria bacterium]